MARLIAPLNERSADYARASRRTGGLSENFSPSANEKAERLAAATATDALRLLTHTADEDKRVTLPTLATAGDVREVVQYLKKKPTGVSVVEALDDVKRRVFEPRKVAAYEFWGIVARHGDRLLLTPLGWDFARKLEPGTEAYRVVLDGTPLYRLALEWIYRQNLDLVTHGDVASYWYEHHGALLDPANDKTMEGHVVCFFHLCQAAELGTVTIGKRGQPARLRVERDELAVYVGRDSERRVAVAAAATTTAAAARPCFPPQFSGAGEAGRREARASDVAATEAPAGAEMRAAPWGSTNEPSARLRLFISCGSQNPKVVSQIQTTLELADIESHVVERAGADASAMPVTDSAFEALRRCDAGLILLTKDDCLADTDGHFTLRQSVLIEIGAAFVLYDRRVVLLLDDDELTLPDNLSALPHFTFGQDDLTWDAGIKLLRAIKGFSSGGRQMTL